MVSCSCDTCTSACTFRPGWFLPGEAEKAAEYLGMPLKEFFKQYLAVDWWADSVAGDIFLLCPATNICTPGDVFPYNPTGTCRLFDPDTKRCRVHPYHPFECREYLHTNSKKIMDTRHNETAEQWKGHQEQIEGLLGHRPFADEPESFIESLCLF